MRKELGWSAVGLLVLGGVASAQVVQPRQPNVRPGTQPGVVQPQPGTVQGQPGAIQRQPGSVERQPGNQNQQGQQSQQADQQIAAVIVACNRAEVEAAKFAMPKLQSSEAKEIATMLIKDHTETANKFSKWAGAHGSSVNTSTQSGAGNREDGRREDRREEGRREENRNEEGRNDRRDDDQSRAPAAAPNANATAANQTALQQGATQPGRPGQPANQPGAIRPAQPAANQPGQPAAGQPHVALKPATGGLDWVAIHREVANESLESCKKELSRYEGNEFDKAFLGHQTGGHLASIASLKVLKRHASSELGSEIDEAIEGAESHLKQIRDLMEEKKDEKNK